MHKKKKSIKSEIPKIEDLRLSNINKLNEIVCNKNLNDDEVSPKQEKKEPISSKEIDTASFRMADLFTSNDLSKKKARNSVEINSLKNDSVEKRESNENMEYERKLSSKKIKILTVYDLIFTVLFS